jgi:hypothetical protein
VRRREIFPVRLPEAFHPEAEELDSPDYLVQRHWVAPRDFLVPPHSEEPRPDFAHRVRVHLEAEAAAELQGDFARKQSALLN